MVDVNEYTHEATCEYKGEVYSVRDNGAVMRHAREGKKVRKLDNVWTFGTKDTIKGYMMINSHRVHIIVAKAFIPGNEDGKMIVDHIDTNRCNNRVENLRWLTRLENVLLNEATLKRVTFLCGGDINKFIENPSCLQDLTCNNQDIMWMRTVTPEEAKLAWEHISNWAKRPSSTFKMMRQKEGTKNLEEWLDAHPIQSFSSARQNSVSSVQSSKFDKKESVSNPINDDYDSSYLMQVNNKEKEESLTTGALQINFFKKMRFPLCPSNSDGSLDSYAKNLKLDTVVASSEDGDEYTISSIGWTEDWDEIQVELKLNGKRYFSCIHITYENGEYIHSLSEYKAMYRFCDSPNVLQCNSKTQCYFPLCPKEGGITLEDYAELLKEGTLFEKSGYGDVYVIDREITTSQDGSQILYIGASMPDSLMKKVCDMIVFIENGKVIHQIGTTYFDERAVKRNICMMRGQEWDDPEEISDDYC